MLLDGYNQTGFKGVGTSTSMCLEVAPNKIVHEIKVGAAGRPLLLGVEVLAVLLEPGHGPVGHMAGGRVLLPDPGVTSSYAGDPGQHCPVHKLEVDVGVDPFNPLPDLKDVQGLDVALVGEHTEHSNHKETWVSSLWGRQ